MNLVKTSLLMGITGLAVMSSAFAAADDTGWYAGASLGQSRATIDDQRISNALRATGFTGVTLTDDDRSTGYKLSGGYQINKNFALEAGFFDLGNFGYKATTVPTGTLNGNIKLRGVNLDVLGMLPVTDNFSAFGRAGISYAQARDAFSGTGLVQVTNPNPSERKANYKVGLGLQYAFSEALAMRAEVERYRINDAVGNRGDIDMISVGLIYRFGAKSPSSTPRATAPVVVALAPVAAPVIVAAKPAPAPVAEKVSFAAEALFDFDKAAIKPEGKVALDGLLSNLQGMNLEVMIAVGHTDSVGKPDYNQKLSVKRADAVKQYLMSKGIDQSRIYNEGKGETQPIADNKTEQGRSQNRRVTLEVVGTRSPK
jgi:OOP family OmpA-OmpF porin